MASRVSDRLPGVGVAPYARRSDGVATAVSGHARRPTARASPCGLDAPTTPISLAHSPCSMRGRRRSGESSTTRAARPAPSTARYPRSGPMHDAVVAPGGTDLTVDVRNLTRVEGEGSLHLRVRDGAV